VADEISVRVLKRILDEAEETLKTVKNELGRDEKEYIKRTLHTKK